MTRTLGIIALCAILCGAQSLHAQKDKKYSIKTADTAPPMELSEPIQALLAKSSVQLLDPAGTPICDVWFRKELPTDAVAEQLKTGVTYREVKQTEILGAIQFHKDWTDYRQQKVKAGVYTLRLAYQPTDGKHTADVSEFQDFALITSAKVDKKSDLMDPKVLHEKSSDSIKSAHPGVFMLWPSTKPGKEPTIVSNPNNHWVVHSRTMVVIAGKATDTPMGIGITLVGHSPVE
jgi:hypothetical protein